MNSYHWRSDLSLRQAFLAQPHVKASRKKLADMLREARRTEPKVAKVLWRRLRAVNAQLAQTIMNEGS